MSKRHSPTGSKKANHLRLVRTRRPPDQVMKRLAETTRRMHESFAEHIGSAEERCGFFAHLTKAAPRYRRMIEYLRTDHAVLMRSIVSLRFRTIHADATDVDGLRTEAVAIQAALDAHDTLEREILADARQAP